MRGLHVAVVGPAEPAEFVEYLSTSRAVPDGLGGVPVNELVKALLELGHDVSLVTASPAVSETWRESGPHLRVAVVPYRTSARARALDLFKAERRAIEAELAGLPVDVTHAHWTYEFALASLAASRAPVLVTAHDAPFTILRLLPDAYRVIRAAMAIRARLSIRDLTAVSPYLATRWRRQMLYRRPIPVISNPVPRLALNGAWRGKHPIVLSVGDASRRKNVAMLVRAFAKVKVREVQAELRLAGPGLDADGELAAWTIRNGLGEGVSFVGRVDRDALSREYANATVFCHPSYEESQGLVLLEALTAGLPVIAGRASGGVPWTLFDGQAGRLIDVSSPDALATAVLDAINDPLSTVTPGFDVGAELAARYGPHVIASQYVREYERLLDHNSAGGDD